MSSSDADIIHAVLAGDKHAFGELIERYWSMVYGIAYQRLAEPMLAEDRAQETFLQAFLSLEHLQNPEQFRAWLYGITLNCCKNYFRKQQDFIQLEEDTLSPDKPDESIEIRSSLETALAQLSPANQEAIILYYYEGFSLNEVAEILQISPTAVKGRLHKSRQMLKGQLASLFPSRIRIKGAKKMIPVQVIDTPQQIKINRHGDYYSLSQVLLFNEESRRALVVWIDEEQALAIAQVLAGYAPEQIRQHDFTTKLIEATKAKLDYVVLDRMAEGVFYATVALKTQAGTVSIDARPSEAIALALRLKAPIYISEKMWEKASPPLPEGKTPNRSGIQSILERLEAMRDAQSTWIQQKRLEHADKGNSPDWNMRKQAREIIDSAFS